MQHAATRLKGDERVRDALDAKLERERALKSSQENPTITMQAEAVFEDAMNANTVHGSAPVDLHQFSLEGVGAMEVPAGAAVAPRFIEQVKESVKSSVNGDAFVSIYEKTKSLIQQGKYMEMLMMERTDAAWKSYIFCLPQGTMKFLINAMIDNLPTRCNLKKWGKSITDLCRLCKARPESLAHITSGCKVALEEKRYDYRHDSVLAYVASCLDSKKFEFAVDVDGWKLPCGGTVPPKLAVTTKRPDICIVDSVRKRVYIGELTCGNERNIERNNGYKMQKYTNFLTDIRGMSVTLEPFEIGASTGLVTERNKGTLKNIHKFVRPDISYKLFEKNITAITVLSTYHIYSARERTDWQAPGLVGPPFKH